MSHSPPSEYSSSHIYRVDRGNKLLTKRVDLDHGFGIDGDRADGLLLFDYTEAFEFGRAWLFYDMIVKKKGQERAA